MTTKTQLRAALQQLPMRSRDEIARLSAINSPRLPTTIVIDGHRKHWVGIGWVDEGTPNGTEQALVLVDVKCPRCAASRFNACAAPNGGYAKKNHVARLNLSVRRAIDLVFEARK